MEGNLGLTPKYSLDFHYAEKNCYLSHFISLILDETVNFILASYKKEDRTMHKDCVIIFVFFTFIFLQLLCISFVSLIFRYSSTILLENALFCQQNARLKNRLSCSKFCRHNLSKPN